MRLPATTMMAVICAVAMLTMMPLGSASADSVQTRKWEIHDLPFPACFDYYIYGNEMTLSMDDDETLHICASWYDGMAFGSSSDWNLVNISNLIEELDMHIDYMRFAVDGAGNTHFVAMTYFETIVYGTNSNQSWVVEVIDDISMTGGWSSVPRPKILVDDNGAVHLCYHSKAEGHELRYATNSGGDWEITSIEQALNSSSTYALALGPDGSPHIAYYNYDTDELRHVTRDGGTWAVESVDDQLILYSVTIDVTDDDHAHIAYCGYIPPENPWDTWSVVRYAEEGDAGWSLSSIEGSWFNSFSGVSGQLDQEGNFHMSYCDVEEMDLVYATNEVGVFQKQRVDAVDFVGSGSALLLDSKGDVHIAYVNETSCTAKYAFGAETSSSSQSGDDEGMDLFLVVAAVSLGATGVGAFLIIRWKP